MKRLLLLALLFLPSLSVAQNYNVNVGGIQYTSGASVPVSCSPDGRWFFKNTTTTGWYQCVDHVYVTSAGTSGGISPTSFGAKVDTKYRRDATITNTSTTVTCPDCSFTAADVGKKVFGLTFNILGSTLILAQTTISAVNSATSITVAAAATGTNSGSAYLIWGTDDTAALAAAWTATYSSGQCYTLELPQGLMLISSALFNSIGSQCDFPYNQPAVQGQGKQTSILVISPTFNYTTCVPACLLGYSSTIAHSFSVYGFYLNPGASVTALVENNGGFVTDMDIEGWCSGCTNTRGMYITGFAPGTYYGGVENSGSIGLYADGTSPQLINFAVLTNNPLTEIAATDAISYGSFLGRVQIDAGKSLISNSDIFNGTVSTINGTLDAAGLNALNDTITLGSTGRIIAKSSQFSPNANNIWLKAFDGGVFQDDGGNTYTGSAVGETPTETISSGSGSLNVSSKATTIAGTQAGSVIVALFSWTGAFTFNTCTDTLGNTFSAVGTAQTTGSTFGAARTGLLLAANGNIGSGSDTITCSVTAGPSPRLDLIATEFTGQDSITLFDRSSNGSGSGTSVNSGALSTVHNSETIVPMFVNTTNATFTPSSPSGTASITTTGFSSDFWQRTYIQGTSYTIAGNFNTNTDWVSWWLEMRSAVPNGLPQIFNHKSSGGTRLSPSIVAYTSGWGASPGAISSVSGDGLRGRFTLTTGTGASASPVFTLTFPKAFQVPPICSATQTGGTATVQQILTGTVSTTTAAFTYNGTPGDGTTISVAVTCN